MAKQAKANKGKAVPSNKAARGGMVKVRVLPFRGVGGLGGPGTIGKLKRARAERLARDGYVEILED